MNLDDKLAFRKHLVLTGLPVIQDRPGANFGPGHYAPVWEQAPAP
jgi:hypothetical protein